MQRRASFSEPGGWLIAQRSPAIGTIDIIYANQALALRTARTKFVAAARAEVESSLDCVSALRAGAAQRLPQEEVKNDAQSVGNNNGQNRPKSWAHAAAFGVAVYIADEQQKTAQYQAEQEPKQRPRPCGWGIGVASHSNIEKPLRRNETNPRQDPYPYGNNLDFRSKPSPSFTFSLHKR